MPKTQLDGIRVKQIIVPARKGRGRSIQYVFELATASHADRMFFTNPKLREIISKNRKKVQDAINIGIIEYMPIQRKSKTGLKTYEEYLTPFGTAAQNKFKLFSGTGIGRELQKIALKETIRLLGEDFVIVPWKTVSEHYEQSLKKRAIPLGRYEEGIRASKLVEATTHAARQYRTNHRVKLEYHEAAIKEWRKAMLNKTPLKKQKTRLAIKTRT